MKYVIYCRRSSDESSEKQTQSIPDQIKRCIDFANSQNPPLEIMEKPENFSDFETEKEIFDEDNDSDLNNRKTYLDTRKLFIIKESHTAKAPYKRPKWRKLISEVKKGNIQGILSYSPDRQARNILEGGELINFVDDDSVGLSLKYTNFHFEPTASGKMMLGVWFVFAKQYSDAISENVNRGNEETIGRGKALGTPKYGYIRRKEDGYYEPEPGMFELMQEAFRLKIYDQKSDRIIADWLNDHGRQKERGGKMLKATGNKLNTVRKDSFYYGLLCEGENTCDQVDHNPYFKALITRGEYEMLADRRHSTSKTPIARKKIRDEYGELSCVPVGMLKSEDGYSLTPNLPNKNKRFLPKLLELQKQNKDTTLADVVLSNQMRYAIKQKLSKYNGMEITGKDIENAVIAKLEGLRVDEKIYEVYKSFVLEKIDEIYKETCEEVNKISASINYTRGEMKKYIEKNLGEKRDKTEQEIYVNKKKQFEDKISRLSKERDLLSQNERDTYVEHEMFMSIMNNASSYYKRGTYVQKAKICEIFFSNMILDDKKRLHIAVKPIFEKLFISTSADDATRTRNILLGRKML